MRKLTHAEISGRRRSRESIGSLPRLPVYAMAENIRSLYNVGSMFRTADGALLQKLYLVGFTPHPPRKEIEKTALGATETVPWEYHEKPEGIIQQMKNLGVRLCAVELTTESKPHFDLRKEDFPLCLVFGNEVSGISNEIVKSCDLAIEIPMIGTKQSLNVAVAFGVVLFHCVRVLTAP